MKALKLLKKRLLTSPADISILELALLHSCEITREQHEQAAEELEAYRKLAKAAKKIAREVENWKWADERFIPNFINWPAKFSVGDLRALASALDELDAGRRMK